MRHPSVFSVSLRSKTIGIGFRLVARILHLLFSPSSWASAAPPLGITCPTPLPDLRFRVCDAFCGPPFPFLALNVSKLKVAGLVPP